MIQGFIIEKLGRNPVLLGRLYVVEYSKLRAITKFLATKFNLLNTAGLAGMLKPKVC